MSIRQKTPEFYDTSEQFVLRNTFRTNISLSLYEYYIPDKKIKIKIYEIRDFDKRQVKLHQLFPDHFLKQDFQQESGKTFMNMTTKHLRISDHIVIQAIS